MKKDNDFSNGIKILNKLSEEKGTDDLLEFSNESEFMMVAMAEDEPFQYTCFDVFTTSNTI